MKMVVLPRPPGRMPSPLSFCVWTPLAETQDHVVR